MAEFDQDRGFLQTLHNKTGHQGSTHGAHSLSLLNTSINN